MRKENYKKWILEGITYRVGDVLIGLAIVPLASLMSFYILKTPLDLSIEIGGTAAIMEVILENVVNAIWYYLNRYVWAMRDE